MELGSCLITTENSEYISEQNVVRQNWNVTNVFVSIKYKQMNESYLFILWEIDIELYE